MSQERLLRLKQIVGDEKAGIPPIIPVSRSTIYMGIANGTFPKPITLFKKVSCWRESDIYSYLQSLNKQ